LLRSRPQLYSTFLIVRPDGEGNELLSSHVLKQVFDLHHEITVGISSPTAGSFEGEDWKAGAK